jgi:translation initiation factor IF-3
LAAALAQDLDLVEIAPTANPPVAKIIDYRKYLFETQQQKKQAKKKSVAVSVKEIKYRINIANADLETKNRHLCEFLRHGCKVRVTIMFKGREATHSDIGFALFEKITLAVGDLGVLESSARFEGLNITATFAPKR